MPSPIKPSFSGVISDLTGAGTGVLTFLVTPTSANLRAALTDETGTGAAVFATSPTLTTPVLGTPTSGNLANCTGYPSLGYAICSGAAVGSPADGQTYYVGSPIRAFAVGASTTGGTAQHRIPKAGTIKVVEVAWDAVTTAGSNETITVNIRLNNTTSTLVSTVGDTNAFKRFTNTALAIAVVQGDYIEIEIVCPTWATNPTNVAIGYTVYIE